MASNSATLGPDTPIAPTMTLRWAMRHSHYPICGIVRAPLRPSVASMVVSMLDTIDATRLSTDVLSMRLETLPTNKRTSPGGCEGAEAVGSIPNPSHRRRYQRIISPGCVPSLSSRCGPERTIWAARSTFADSARTRSGSDRVEKPVSRSWNEQGKMPVLPPFAMRMQFSQPRDAIGLIRWLFGIMEEGFHRDASDSCCISSMRWQW